MLSLYNFTANVSGTLVASAVLHPAPPSTAAAVVTQPAARGDAVTSKTRVPSPPSQGATLLVHVAPDAGAAPLHSASMEFVRSTIVRVNACTVLITAAGAVQVVVWPDTGRATAYHAAAQTALAADNDGASPTAVPQPRYILATLHNAQSDASMSVTLLQRTVTVQRGDRVVAPVATWTREALTATVSSGANAAQKLAVQWTTLAGTAQPVVRSDVAQTLLVHIPSQAALSLTLFSTVAAATQAAQCATASTARTPPAFPPTAPAPYTASVQVVNPSTASAVQVTVAAQGSPPTSPCAGTGVVGAVCPTDGSTCTYTAAANSSSVPKAVLLRADVPHAVTVQATPSTATTPTTTRIPLPALGTGAVTVATQDTCAAAQTRTQCVVALFDTAAAASTWSAAASKIKAGDALPSVMPDPSSGGGGSGSAPSNPTPVPAPPQKMPSIVFVYGGVILIVLVAVGVLLARTLRSERRALEPDVVRNVEMKALRRNAAQPRASRVAPPPVRHLNQ